MNDDQHGPGLVCVPVMDRMWTLAADALRKLQMPEGSAQRWMRGTQIPAPKRNKFVRQFLSEDGFRWLAFIDADQTPPPDTVLRLLEHDVPIVSALIFARVEPHFPCCGYLDGEGGGRPLRRIEPGGGLVEVDYTGCGSTVVRREVFEVLEADPFEADPDGGGEDVAFCRKAREAGYSIYVDPATVVGHVGSTSIGLDYVRTWWRTREAQAGLQDGYDQDEGWNP